MIRTSEAQKRATQAYRARNRKKTTMQSAKSAAKTFINNYAELADLEELKMLIEKRMSDLKKDV
ncbi:hypothetical protein ACFQ5M_02315 [Agrilactobacillus yilanensis]|uniref:DUF3847 domain-containing protein n=1 Tax=Agrilactobacillus yilanensis TaxID=2485997 RepID=A0ABW4J7J6_9LACO|nr:hypothetical protein [Agrilactobacillus yilanensis]